MLILALISALTLLEPGTTVAAPSSDAAAFLAATWEVMMYDHVDLRDGAWILEASGFKPEAVARDLSLILKDSDVGLGVKAAGFLARIGPRAAVAVPALTEGILDERSADMRWACVRALGRVGPEARTAVHPLLAALQDQEPMVRVEAARALGSIGIGSAVVREALKRGGRDLDPEVRRASAGALAALSVAPR